MEANESESEKEQRPVVIQHSPPSVKDDVRQSEKREGKVAVSSRQLHELGQLQSLPCSKTWLALEGLTWQLCHHQAAHVDCRRA